MRLSLLFLSLIPHFLTAQVFSDANFRKEAETGLHAMYNFEFEKAQAVFDQLETKWPEHPAPYFLQATNRWWQTYLSVDMSTYYGYIEKRTALALEKNKALKESYPREFAFFAFMNHALVARLQSYRDNWMRAFNAARKTIGPVKDCISYVGNEPEFYMVAGLYHYYVATYGDIYPVARPFLSFFPDGDKEKGLKEIETAGSLPGLGQHEANFFLYYIYLDEEERLGDGLALCGKLTRLFPKNTWFATDYARAMVLNGQYDGAGQLLDKIIARYEGQTGHNSRSLDSRSTRYTTHLMTRVYHIKGLQILRQHHEYDEALAVFQKSLAMSDLTGIKEDNVVAGSQYYIGVCHDNLSQRQEAIAAYEDTLDMEENAPFKDRAKQGLKAPVLIR
ncbi:MAG: tetratricopeptide repeat protein [Bacteroidota bacterium]